MEKFLAILSQIIGFVQDLASIVSAILAALHATNDVLNDKTKPEPELA